VGDVYVLEYDQNASGFPAVAINREPNAGLGMVVPAFNSLAPAGLRCLGITGDLSTLGYYFSERKVLAGARLVQDIYRQFPGSWAFSRAIDAETDIIGYIAKGLVPNAEGNQAGQFTGPVVVNGKSFGGGITITLSSGGTGYTSATTIAFTGGTFTVAAAAVPIIAGGVIVGFYFLSPGNYTVKPTGIVITDTGGGTGAAGTLSFTGDLVVVEYEPMDASRDVILVTTFSATQIAGLSETTITSGNYPIPPTLLGIAIHDDSSDWAYAFSDGANYSWQIEIGIEGVIEKIWSFPPEKLVGTITKTYHLGPPSVPSQTQIIASSGEIIMLGAGLRSKQDAWQNDSSTGASAAGSVDKRYGSIGIEKCLVNATSVFANLPAPNIPTVNYDGYDIYWSALSGTPGFSTNIGNSTPKCRPTKITEAATAKQKFSIYEMQVITWTVPAD
jgi:hypothetical protein